MRLAVLLAILGDTMEKEPLVHVLVINWNGLEHLEACFSSLLAGGYENVKYVLVDNASEDESVAFVEREYGGDARVEVLKCPGNLGWSGGNNFGIEHALEAGAKYIFLLNNDTAVEADAIPKMLAMAEADETIGALAPKMLMFNQPEILNSVGLYCSYIGASWDRGIGQPDSPQWDTPEEVIGVCGGAMFLRVEVLEKTGLLPEEFEIYLDDLDLCLRIWNAGYRIMTCPAARVRHKFSATYGDGARARYKYYLNTRNRFYIIMRHFPVLQLFLGVGLLVDFGEVRAIGRAMLEGEWWRVGTHARAWLDIILYYPAALRYRIDARKRGLKQAAFWQHIYWGRMFPEQWDSEALKNTD